MRQLVHCSNGKTQAQISFRMQTRRVYDGCDFSSHQRQPRCCARGRGVMRRPQVVIKVESGHGGNSLWNWHGSSARRRSPSPGPSPAPQNTSSSGQSLGRRLLNLGPTAAPAVIATALAEATKFARPLQPISAAGGDSSYSAGNGMGSSNGRGSGGSISVAELDSMLHGLRTSLASIQESRAQYVTLLAERDATISNLQSQLDTTLARMHDLESQVYAMGSSEAAVEPSRSLQARLDAAETRAAQAEAQIEDLATRAAVAEQHALEYESLVSELEARASKAETRAATAEAKALVTQELLQQQAHEIDEAKAIAARLNAQMTMTPPPPPPPPPPPAPTHASSGRMTHPPQARPMNEITITYRTGWKQVYIHCNQDNKGWTAIPGILMDSVGSDMKVARLTCQRIEFVFNNGKSDWDSNNGNNYNIYTPGSYRMENGCIQRVQ